MKNRRFILLLSLFIAILNLFDGIATHFGLIHNIIEEANPIMKTIATFSPALFLLIKTLLSILIVAVSYWIYKYSLAAFQRFYFLSLVGVLTLYIGIFSMHIFWLVLL
ncbi:DUF5658 family protein [Lysinibacillus sp. 54212]|uniref:DUF5658 family protein n=1 Tax=Lysinibacillus sp. 54212 TaxID=3119829 RepID=UPI002FCB2E32